MRTLNNILLKTVFASMLIASFFSCKVSTTDKNNLITGRILDLDKNPISNVVIKLDDKIIGKSNTKGEVSLSSTSFKTGNVLSFENAAFVKVYKVMKEGSTLDVFMKRRSDSFKVDTEKGGVIKFGDGGLLNIPKNAFSLKNKLFKGNANIQVTYIDVTNAREIMSAPGAYIAENKEGDLYPLTSFGIVEINVRDSKSNDELDLGEGISLEISYPIKTENTPDSVNLYELNEQTGYWSERGFLTNNGSTLQGVVTTVNSAWNADDPCSQQLVCVKIKIQYANISGGPSGCRFSATGLSYQGFDGFYYPDSNGDIQFMVCPDSAFKIEGCFLTCTNCPGAIYSKMIDLSTITMNPSGCTDLGTWVIQN